MIILFIILAFLISFLMTYRSIPTIVNVSNAKNLFDVPDKRKLNKTAIPTLGGVPIFIGFVLSSFLLIRDSASELRMLFAAVFMMFFIGIKDDIVVLAAKKKLIVQSVAAMVLVLMGGFRITQAYGFAGTETFGNWLAIPLSVMIILFLINSVNLIDGIDGLAASLSLMVSLLLGTWFFASGHLTYAILCASLSGSLIAFLRFNLSSGKNKIFMGDTGSLILGVFLAAIAIKFNELNAGTPAPLHFPQAPVVILSLLIVPVTDTLRVFAIRIKNGLSPFQPDMNHFHHLLIRLNFSHIQASCFMLAYTLAFVVFALLLSWTKLNINLSFFLLLSLSFGSVGLIYFLSKQVVEKKERRQLKSLGPQVAISATKPEEKTLPVPRTLVPSRKTISMPEETMV